MSWLAVGFSFSLPLGEGLAQVVLGLLVVATIALRLVRGPLSASLVSDLDVADGWWSVDILLFGIGAWVVLAVLPWFVQAPFLFPPGWEAGKLLMFIVVPLCYWLREEIDVLTLRYMLLAFCVGLALSSLVGVLQYAFNTDMGASVLGSMAHVGQRRVPGVPEQVAAGGTFFHRLKLAHVQVLGLGLCFGLLLQGRKLWPRFAHRMIIVAAILLSLLALPFTFARSALVAVACMAMLALFMVADLRFRALILGLGMLFSAGVFVFPTTRARIVSMSVRTQMGPRAIRWVGAAELLEEPSLLGIGYGRYPMLSAQLYKKYQPQLLNPSLGRGKLHNLLMSTWVELGLLGLAALMLVFGGAGFLSIRKWRQGRQKDVAGALQAGIGAGVFLSLGGLTVVGLTHDVLYHVPVLLTFVWMLGLLWFHSTELPEVMER